MKELRVNKSQDEINPNSKTNAINPLFDKRTKRKRTKEIVINKDPQRIETPKYRSLFFSLFFCFLFFRCSSSNISSFYLPCHCLCYVIRLRFVCNNIPRTRENNKEKNDRNKRTKNNI